MTWIPDCDRPRLDRVAVERRGEGRSSRSRRPASPNGIPIVSRRSGRVLQVLAADRQRIVEVGTAIGYSTLWMALGQPAGGTIVTIDPDTSRTDERARVLAAGRDRPTRSPVSARALTAFGQDEPALAGPFDLAFIDALKPEYAAYLEELVPRLAPNALVVADNVLWSGRASGTRPTDPDDENTMAIRAFDTALLADQRFRSTILPVGDGLLIASYRG